MGHIVYVGVIYLQDKGKDLASTSLDELFSYSHFL